MICEGANKPPYIKHGFIMGLGIKTMRKTLELQAVDKYKTLCFEDSSFGGFYDFVLSCYMTTYAIDKLGYDEIRQRAYKLYKKYNLGEFVNK